MVIEGGSWPKERDHRYKWLKWTFSGEELGSPLMRISVICEALGVELIVCEDGRQLGCSRHVSLAGGHGSDQGLRGEIISLH